ncbi:MAG: hypothetical protein ACNA7W_05500 [Pseudomonadales bacterium]
MRNRTFRHRHRATCSFAASCMLTGVLLVSPFVASAQTSDEASADACASVDLQCLETLLRRFDRDLQGSAGNWQLSIGDRSLVVVTDAQAGRMRMMVPIAPAAQLERDQLYRLMQANFETALDARYSIANGLVWSAFIHPLAPLSVDQLVSAIAQTMTLAETYGTTFTSGALSYGGGDGANERYEQLKKEGTLL